MRKPLIILTKVVVALLSAAGMGLLIFEGWLIWRYEYGIGLPDKDKLVAVSKTGPLAPLAISEPTFRCPRYLLSSARHSLLLMNLISTSVYLQTHL